MTKLGQSASEEWPQEVADRKAAQAQQRRQERIQRASELARKLSEAADLIPGTIDQAQLSDAERQAFSAHVARLKLQADELSAQAGAGDVKKMERTLKHVKATCYDCHNQFRAQAGPLSFGW